MFLFDDFDTQEQCEEIFPFDWNDADDLDCQDEPDERIWDYSAQELGEMNEDFYGDC